MGVAIRIPLLRRESAPKKARRTRGQPAREQRRAQPGNADRRGRRDQAQAGAARKAQAGATRKAQHGATRKAPAVAEKPQRSFRWLERIIILLGIGVVLAAGLKGWIALQSLPVKQITVTGELEHVSTAAIREMVEPELAGGFIGADLGELSHRLEALPWVYKASVRRVWPNSLDINIDEQLPIARWGDAGFLNHQGDIFRPSPEKGWETLPLLQGPDREAQSMMRNYQRLVEMLSPLGLSVARLGMDDRGEISAVLRGGQKLVIGGTDFFERMQRFTAVYRADLAKQMDRVERIDLRYAHGVAVAFAPPSEEDSSAHPGDNGKA